MTTSRSLAESGGLPASQAGVLDRGARVVHRARADYGEQAVIAAIQNGPDLVPRSLDERGGTAQGNGRDHLCRGREPQEADGRAGTAGGTRERRGRGPGPVVSARSIETS